MHRSQRLGLVCLHPIPGMFSDDFEDFRILGGWFWRLLDLHFPHRTPLEVCGSHLSSKLASGSGMPKLFRPELHPNSGNFISEVNPKTIQNCSKKHPKSSIINHFSKSSDGKTTYQGQDPWSAATPQLLTNNPADMNALIWVISACTN